MKKNKKVLKLIQQNGIEMNNFTLVLRLKNQIQQLKQTNLQQQKQIAQLKKSSKNTLLNQYKIEIQHLRDQNKRLQLINPCKTPKPRSSHCNVHKSNIQSIASPSKSPQIEKTQNKHYYLLLRQNEYLRKQLVKLKNQQHPKRRKSLKNQNSLILSKNTQESEILFQKNFDLQAQLKQAYKKIAYLQSKLLTKNENSFIDIESKIKQVHEHQ